MDQEKEIKQGLVFAVLAYLSILCVIPLIFKKDNKFALHHGKQGMVLFVAEIALGLIAWVPVLGWTLAPLGSFLALGLSFIGIIQALMGNYWKCPVVFDLAERIKI